MQVQVDDEIPMVPMKSREIEFTKEELDWIFREGPCEVVDNIRKVVDLQIVRELVELMKSGTPNE